MKFKIEVSVKGVFQTAAITGSKAKAEKMAKDFLIISNTDVVRVVDLSKSDRTIGPKVVFQVAVNN